MKNYTTHIIQKASLMLALMVLAFLFNANAQTVDNSSENIIRIKVMKDVNGKQTLVDTTFTNEEDANAFMKNIDGDENEVIINEEDIVEEHFNFEGDKNDLKLKNFSFNFHDDSLNKDNGIFKFQFSKPNWSEEDRAKLEVEMENLQKEIKQNFKSFDMDWDTSTTGSNFNYNFKFKIPDEKEMEQLKEELKNLNFNMPDIDNFSITPISPFNFKAEGFCDADKKKFDEQMKKAEKEYEKAIELLKDKNGTLRMPSPSCPGSFQFNYNNEDKTGKNVNKKLIVVQKSEAKSDKNKSTKSSKTKTNFEEGSSANFQVKDFKCFPNPSNGKFDLNFNLQSKGDLILSITDASGKKIVVQALTDFSGNYNQSFDISEHGAGVYLLNIRQGNEWMHKKVVVKK